MGRRPSSPIFNVSSSNNEDAEAGRQLVSDSARSNPGFDISYQRLLHQLLPIAAGFVGCLGFLYGAHVIAQPQPQSVDFSPQTCTQPPTDCWDTWNKESFPKCTYFSQPTLVRGHWFEPGSVTCYKPIYFNIEPRTFWIAALFLFWALLVGRGLERMARVVLVEQRPRWRCVAAAAFNLWSIWYSLGVLIHYLNDANFAFFYSQLYFSLTEIYLFSVTLYLVDAHASLPAWPSQFAFATSLYHMFQVLMDEQFLLFGDMHGKAATRNVAFFLTDLLYVVAMWSVAPVKRNRWFFVAAVMLVNLVAFQVLFADQASNGASYHG